MTPNSTTKKSAGLRVLLIGYYGHLNAGDDLLQQALTYIFQDHKLMFSSWQPSAECMNECDLLVIGGGSIWPDFSFFQNAGAYAKVLRAPLLVLGISSRRVDPVVLGETRKLIDVARLFHVRDQATFREFGSPDRIRQGTDLFWWMPWSPGRRRVVNDPPKTIAVNLRGWNADWHPSEVLAAINGLGLSSLPLPLYFGSPRHDQNVELNDADFLAAAGFVDVQDHWSEENLLRSDICVAMRYHAILMSTRCGIPAVGFDFHPKMVAFFKENGIDELCVPLNDTAALRDAIERIAASYGEYVAKFHRIARRLEDVGAADLAHCRSVLSNIEPRPSFSILARILRKALQLFA